MADDLLVMGLPRSGTTLLSALIDSAPRAVCLSEPPLPLAEAVRPAARFAELLARDVAGFRAKVAGGEAIVDFGGAGGERVTNYVERGASGGGRTARQRPRLVPVPEGDFTLAVKHNGPFLAALPELNARAHWRTVALVRHPETSFSAWLNSGMRIARGRFAARYWPETERIAHDAAIALPRKLALIYAIVAERLAEAPPWRLLRYEALRDDPAAVLDAIGIAGADLSLVTGPARHDRGGAVVAEALAELRAIGGAAVRLYDF